MYPEFRVYILIHLEWIQHGVAITCNSPSIRLQRYENNIT